MSPVEFPVSGKKVLKESVQLKYRIASGADPNLIAAISRVCSVLAAVRRCFLLEALFPGDPEIKLMIVPLCEAGRECEADNIARHLQEMLRAFPDAARRTVIMFDEGLVSELDGRQIYSKSVNPSKS